jgi:hypothetical protein
MRIGLNIAAFFLSSIVLCNAPALAAGADDPGGAATADTSGAGVNASHSSGNVAPTSGSSAASPRPVSELPFASNEGTLAESANTTALATSTYHQNTGILPGLK